MQRTGGEASACKVQRMQRGLFGGCGLESWWLRRWAASSDRWAGRGLQGTASQSGRQQGCGKEYPQQSGSPVVGWQQLLRAAVSSAQRGRAEHLTEIQREGGTARCRTGRCGCGKERFGGKSRRGALAKSDITHGQARWDWCCGLDPEPLSSTATIAGLKLIRLREYSKHLQRSQSYRYRDSRVR